MLSIGKYPRLLLGFSIFILLFACDDKSLQSTTKNIIHSAKVFTVKNSSTQNYRNFPAEVEANTRSQLAFRVNGQIIHFPVHAGNKVKKGDLLAQLEPNDFQLRIDDKQARYQLAQSKFKRTQRLFKKGLVSRSKYDEAKSHLSVALSSLNIAKMELKYTHLTAPFNGHIAHIMVKNHESVQINQAILTLTSHNKIDISIQLPEKIISRIKKETNYQPTVTFDSHPNQHFLVSTKEWDTEPNPKTLTYKVVFSLTPPKAFNVLPGMSANIRIDLSKVMKNNEHYFLLPISAIFLPEHYSSKSHSHYIWRINQKTHRVIQQKVTLGAMTEDGIKIISGIKAGDKIIEAGVHFLSEGMKIKEWNREKGL
jgi:RND family efflux transporter MFP subunit